MTRAPDPLADPLGVIIDLVADLEPALARDRLTEVVAGVAGGRAKRRRLAEALLARPAILIDGCSPAPEAIGTLLTVLRDAGAVNVSPPVCAECAKPLRAFQRRGQDWYCGRHGPARAACAGCGNVRPIARRDRQHQPHCVQCPPSQEQDSTAALIGMIAGIEPGLEVGAVTAAIEAAAPHHGQRQRLAWAVAQRPELLTGAGAGSPVPAVLRLIDALVEHGSGRIVAPPCPHCGRVIALVKPRDGLRLCRNCVAKSRAETCSRCGVHREAATRDRQGHALCPKCLITDPANHEVCLTCQRPRPVSVRTPQGPICGSCRPSLTMTCSICGRSAPGSVSTLTGQPCCRSCQRRRARCRSCGTVRLVRSGTPTHPLCGPCTRPDGSWHACPGCDEQTWYRSGRCARCALTRRLDQLLRDDTGQLNPRLLVLHEHLAGHDRPDTVLAWLNKDTAATLVHELATGRSALTHAGLDELPDSKPVRHLRAVLVATGALPQRDEYLARLEQWITTTLTDRADPEQRALLRRYTLWHTLARLRARNNEQHATHGQAIAVQRNIRAAITLLDWLTRRGLHLEHAGQGDLEQWLADAPGTARVDAGNFVRWARRNKLTTLTYPATKWDGPQRVIDSQARWEHARRLLHDNTLKAEDRVAGLLVLLYAQSTATISRLTLEHVHATEHDVRLQLGREPILLPRPLDALVRELITTRHGHAILGDLGASRWLFPGGQPGRPISAARLGERLQHLGLHPGQDRSTALFGLAAELPAALLTRMLGIDISVAVAWQRASAGDWTSYAADYSRRNHKAPEHEGQQHS